MEHESFWFEKVIAVLRILSSFIRLAMMKYLKKSYQTVTVMRIWLAIKVKSMLKSADGFDRLNPFVNQLHS